VHGQLRQGTSGTARSRVCCCSFLLQVRSGAEPRVQSAASTVTASDSRESLCGTVCGRGAAIKFYVLGDTHGREEAIAVAVRHAKMEGCQQIVQVGDFGYWPHVPDGGEFLAYVEKVCAENDVMFWWLDGNHENHDRLEVLVDEHGRDKPIELSPHVHYLPRSCRWKWEGVTFMALGGAYSIDQQWRTPHISWWSSAPSPLATSSEPPSATGPM
jgi:hypothetical protein